MQTSRSSTATSLGTLTAVVVTGFVLCTLYFGREVLVPVALAALLAFLLTPVVVRLEGFIGRVAGALVAVLVFMGVIIGIGWVLTGQMINLAEKLPDYQVNIRTKMQALKVPTGGNFSRVASMFAELRSELPGADPSPRATAYTQPAENAPPPPPGKPQPVEVVETKRTGPMETAGALIAPLMGPLGTTALVLLLVIIMLLQRENLRSRLTRLIGGGNISATKRAMDDAASRVARYLQMQFVVNITYGVLVATGLYFIGVPNVLVWGVLSAVLRFIPYVGSWIAAACPMILSLAVSDHWSMLLMTMGMFAVIELLFANVVEPWLYGSHTGVSAFALILAAVFWTWIWGAAGLVLATPLTVCLVVMARHVPALSMLGVLLSDEEPLAPHEEFYHRLLSPSESDVGDFAESYIKAHSQTEFFDAVFVPTLASIERDQLSGELETPQYLELQEDMDEVIEDLATWPAEEPKAADAKTADAKNDDTPTVNLTALPVTCRVLCLPARAVRDGIASDMLAQMLELRHFSAESLSAQLTTGELLEAVVQDNAEVLCISVIAPTTIIQTRYLCGKLRASCPKLRIIVGLWGATEKLPEATQRLRASGADLVVTTLAEALGQLSKYATTLSHEAALLAPSADETARLVELDALQLMDSEVDPAFDRITKKLARILNVPIALVSLVDADRQFFKSQCGLPPDLARTRSTSRELSICNQVVSSNKALVVEDLARDRRFASNSLVRDLKLRFYAGFPLRTPTGHALGSLCVLDYKPRKFGDHETRLLEVTAEEVMDLVNSRSLQEMAAA